MEIMFEDLTPEAQKRLLKEARVARPEDMDWDEMPVAIVEFESEEYDIEDEDDDYYEEMDNMYDDDEEDFYD